MMLICDSGSTKADWILSASKQISEFQTQGLNPVHLLEKQISDLLGSEQVISDHGPFIKEVHFFGAGCGSKEGRQRMFSALRKVFPSAEITVENDLLAAALSTSGKNPGIICILGTGSNCCYYDGTKIQVKDFGLGYILGDEGSGAWFGKNFLRAFLYVQLPQGLSDSLVAAHQLDREKIIEAVYGKPQANLFLSSFMPFMAEHRNDPWMKKFFLKGISEFFETNVTSFEESKNLPIHFVGSVASLLEAEIRKTGAERNLSIGKILKRPMDGLKEYFVRK